MSNPSEHNETYPLIAENTVDLIKDILQKLQLCTDAETIDSVTKAGEGNMNVVLRVRLADRSLIVKQSRPFVAKYPSIAAPEERIIAELNFYRRVQASAKATAALPTLLGFDAERRTMVLQDLGAATDYMSLYGSEEGSPGVNTVFEQAIGWLVHLHDIVIEPSEASEIRCRKLIELNHAHQYVIPFQSAAVDLDAICLGFMSESNFIRNDEELRAAITGLGDRYLGHGPHLLHGDYYPGSWLKTDAGFHVIDPEFCFAGPVEFDLGVLAAHWIFCGATSDQSTIKRVCQTYGRSPLDDQLVAQFAGGELIRRLIGVGQLPLTADLGKRLEWLKAGRSLVLNH